MFFFSLHEIKKMKRKMLKFSLLVQLNQKKNKNKNKEIQYSIQKVFFFSKLNHT